MANYGQFQWTQTDANGKPLSGVTLTIRQQGASVNGAQSGTAPFTVNVDHCGDIQNGGGDVVAINTGSTTYNVDSATGSTVVLSGFAGTLVLNDDDRITIVTGLNGDPLLYNNAAHAETVTNPLTTNSNGYAQAWLHGGYYDILVASGVTTTLYSDWFVSGHDTIASVNNSSALSVYSYDTNQTITNASKMLARWSNNTTLKASISKDGLITAEAGFVATTGGVKISAGGLDCTGNSTITGTLAVSSTLTASNNFTLSAGTFTTPNFAIATSSLALNSVNSIVTTATDATDNVFTTAKTIITQAHTATANNMGIDIEVVGTLECAASNAIAVRIKLDGTTKYTWKMGLGAIGGLVQIPLSIKHHEDTVAAGSHTWVLEAERTTGAGTTQFLGSSVAATTMRIRQIMR